MPPTPFHDKTILAVLLQWDYGKQSRGVSCEKLGFYLHTAFWSMVVRSFIESAPGCIKWPWTTIGTA